MDFAGTDVWIFDLDNTLYPPTMALFPQIEARMTAYVMRLLAIEQAHADHLRDTYWQQHGTTLAGLMAEHAIDPAAYLAEVHDVDMRGLSPAPDLAAAITALPGRKIVHTNGDSTYARKVLAARGLDVFEAIYGIEETGFHPKPVAAAYRAVIDLTGLDPARAAFFEDDPRNLKMPHELGMRTILVTPEAQSEIGRDLPGHIDWQTHDLPAFLRAIAPPGGTGQNGARTRPGPKDPES